MRPFVLNRDLLSLVTIMIRSTIITLLFGALLSWSVCLADDEPANRELLFDRLDQNQDGLLKSEEIDDGQRRAFERLIRVGDADGDGQLTKAEYLAASRPEEPMPLQQAGRGQGGQRGGQGRLDVEQLFERADQDGDGKIALDDLPEPAQQRLLPLFERIGKDELTREDFARLRPMPGPRPSAGSNGRPDQRRQITLLRVLDADGNGMLSQSELARINERFSDLDRDADGQLGPGELIGFPAAGTARQGTGQRPDSPAQSQRPRRPGEAPDANRTRPESDQRRSGRFGAGQTISRLDADGDGMLSRDEAPGRMAERFDRIDADGDGKISAGELQRAYGAARRNADRDESGS